MSQSFYRTLIVIMAAWASLLLPTWFLASWRALQANGPSPVVGSLLCILMASGFALIPISTIGLWSLRRWGFVTLLLGALIVLTIDPFNVLLHAICIVITIIRFGFARSKAGAAVT